MAGAAAKIDVTVVEFDRFVDGLGDGRRYELFDGLPVLMSNPNETHEQIVGNIGAPLKLAMDQRGCRTYMGGMMVQASASPTNRDKFRPDILVRCGPPSTNTFVTDPIVVIEVLSLSTIDRDRGPKLQFYKDLPTVLHIVLAYADQVRIEHYVRNENGWDLEVLTTLGHALDLQSIDFSIDLGTVYFDVPFEKAPSVLQGNAKPKV